MAVTGLAAVPPRQSRRNSTAHAQARLTLDSIARILPDDARAHCLTTFRKISRAVCTAMQTVSVHSCTTNTATFSCSATASVPAYIIMQSRVEADQATYSYPSMLSISSFLLLLAECVAGLYVEPAHHITLSPNTTQPFCCPMTVNIVVIRVHLTYE